MTPNHTSPSRIPVTLIVLRSSHDEITFARLTYQLTPYAKDAGLDSDRRFFELLMRLLSEWVRDTAEGMAFYSRSARDANIGDLASDGIPQSIREGLARRGVHDFDIEVIQQEGTSPYWTYDMQLVDEAIADEPSMQLIQSLRRIPLHTRLSEVSLTEPYLAQQLQERVLPDFSGEETVADFFSAYAYAPT